MAKHLTADAPETPLEAEPTGHSPSNRKTIIIDVIRRLSILEAERKALSDEMREIRNREIKGDLGMKLSDFNVARRLYLLEGDDRRQMLSTIRETFDALGVGEQLDWITATERAAA